MTDGEQVETAHKATRRTVLRGAMVAGVAAPLLAACGGSDEPDTTETSKTPTSSGKSPTGGGESPSGGGDSGAIATTSEVPEGGGIILAEDEVVVTQPAAGTFKGFSSTCTHMGCTLDNVTDGTINCICHGSMFSIKDGSVVGGPAPSPLPEKPIIVEGKDILLA